MSNTPANIGTTLASGIQDVSALLPLLGTEQVERHVGSALEKGYLYAAASNLSLFGSLGRANAAFATCVATITHRRFYGGQWLDDAGFSTAGSVTSMVTIDKDTGLYGVEVKLKKLLEEQHIDDPNLVSGFEWSGWGRVVPEERIPSWNDGYESYHEYWKCLISHISKGEVKLLVPDAIGLGRKALYSWNVQLIIMSALCATVGITPYIYLASCQWSNPLSWVYPVLRSFGSFLCAVCIQLALQLRIHCITNTSLKWLKVKHKKDGVLEGAYIQKVQPLEQRIHGYICNTKSPSSIEQGKENVPNDVLDNFEALLTVSKVLIVYQLLIAAGMVMIIVGYVGCFSIVKNSAQAGPYVWFGMEAFLSLLRMVLWGLNPSWDESTGLTMKLKLHASDDPYYSLITSPHNSKELGFDKEMATFQPFPVHSEAEFFSAATGSVGPLQCLGANIATLYYALLANQGSNTQNMCKDLCITVQVLGDSRTFTFLCHGAKSQSITVFLSKLETVSDAGYQILLKNQVKQADEGFLRSQLFDDILQYTQDLHARLIMQPKDFMHLQWNLLNSPEIHRSLTVISTPLSLHDRDYINLSKWRNFMSTYMESHHSLELSSVFTESGQKDSVSEQIYTEALALLECALLEVWIWHAECNYLDRQQDWNQRLLSQLMTECTGAMVARVSGQKKIALSRCHEYGLKDPGASSLKLVPMGFEEAWSHLLNMLQKLRAATSTGAENLQQLVHQYYNSISLIGFERADTVIELSSHLLPASLYSILISNTACSNGKALREKSLYHLCLALQYMPNDPPLDTVFYAAVNNVLTLPYIQKKVNLQVLEISLNGMNKKSFREYFSSIIYPNQNTTHTTTLIVHDFNSDSFNLKSALTDHITKHPNILCLAGTRCHQLGRACGELYCKAILANQETWKKSVRGGLDFVYWVGFEAFSGLDAHVKGNYIQLWDTGRALVLFYVPGPGEVTVTLSVCNRRDCEIELWATLRLDVDRKPVTKPWKVSAGHTGTEDACENVVFEFSVVQGGVGEISITGTNQYDRWCIHRLIRVSWNKGNVIEQRED